jgi:uncharacterized protein (DUF433 family)
MTIATERPHICLDERGVAWVDQTNTKVREVVLDVLAHGWGAKEIHLNHPHLSLGQIHAALAFYYDNKDQLDTEIERSVREAERIRADLGESPIRRRLRAIGKLD